MQPYECLLVQMELEGIKRLSSDSIACSPDNAADCPLVISARTSDGEALLSVNVSVPDEIRSVLPATDLQALDMASSVDIFREHGFRTAASHFKTYVFPSGSESRPTATVNCLRRTDPKVAAFGFDGFSDRVFAIDNEDMILSACVSSRQNHKAAEAWVLTHPDHRQKGLARQVVMAWAAAMQQDGLIPFYSHNIKNTNSAKLARSLDLTPVFEEAVIELSVSS